MRSFFLIAFCLCFQFCLKAQPYALPDAIRPKYFFKPGDSVVLAEKPSMRLMKLLKQFVYLPGDSFRTEQADGYDTIIGLYGSEYKLVHNGFFYSKTEVSNTEYKKFLYSTKQSMRPDTSCWLGGQYYSEPMASYYYQHPVYSNYPVCGVSFEQATTYCRWLQDSLNGLLGKIGLSQQVKVDLPSADEWLCIYYDAMRKQDKKSKSAPSKPSYLKYALPGANPGVVCGVLYTSRFAELQPTLQHLAFTTTPVDGIKPIGGVYHILGNMAEWTRTSAEGHLFNNKEYIYTVTGRLAPNVYERQDSAVLKKYLRGAALKNMMVVKGGSWLDEHYYLQPGAQYLMEKSKSSCKVGFRPIIRIVKP